MIRAYGCVDLLDSLRMLVPHKIPIQFLLACVANDEAEATRLARQLVDGDKLQWMVLDLLLRHAPEHEKRWSTLYETRRRSWERCIDLMRGTLSMSGGKEAFDTICIVDHGYKEVIRTDWRKLRLNAAYMVQGMLEDAPKVRGCLIPVKAAVRDLTGCDHCTKRLMRTFSKAMEETMFKVSTEL